MPDVSGIFLRYNTLGKKPADIVSGQLWQNVNAGCKISRLAEINWDINPNQVALILLYN